MEGWLPTKLRKFRAASERDHTSTDLAVAETHRRQGIATALIEALREEDGRRGAWVNLTCRPTQATIPAIELYTKMGVREDVLHFDIPV